VPPRVAVGGTASHRVVLLSFGLQIPQTASIVAAAVVTSSSALVAQTFAACADLAVQAFLVIGIRASMRGPDATHPLGYGRERYFWSLYAALAIFVSGFAVAGEEALRGALDPQPITAFAVGYAVLAANIVLDGVALAYALREVHQQAMARHRSLGAYVRSTTELATVTEMIGNGIAFFGGTVALVALALTQTTGSVSPDTIASALIGVALMVAAVAVTQQNRSLLTGRGVSPRMLERMRSVIASQSDIVDVPDLFAVVVGPSMLIVDGDVMFADGLDVSEVEAGLNTATQDLRRRWPEIRYVYLTPVSGKRPRGAHKAAPCAPLRSIPAASGTGQSAGRATVQGPTILGRRSRRRAGFPRAARRSPTGAPPRRLG
jgi:cation diffusion facilitator family transporter